MIIVIILKMNKQQEKAEVNDTAKESVAAVRMVTSEVLFAGAKELVIRHRGEDYRLRLTSQEKLILTK